MSLAAAMGTLALATSAQAAVMVTTETDLASSGPAHLTAYTPTFTAGGPSGSDLLEGLSASSFSGNFEREGSAGLSALTDGSVQTYYHTTHLNDAVDYLTTHSAYATGDDGSAGQEAVYDLGATIDLAEIVIYGGWNDGGRDQQNVDVLVSADNISFTSLGATLAAMVIVIAGRSRTATRLPMTAARWRQACATSSSTSGTLRTITPATPRLTRSQSPSPPPPPYSVSVDSP